MAVIRMGGMAFDPRAFGQFLRHVREHAGVDGKRLARQTLARASRVAPSTIQAAEDGAKVPGVDTLARIVEAQALTLGVFFSAYDAGVLPQRSSLRGLSEKATTMAEPWPAGAGMAEEAPTRHAPGLALSTADLATRPIVVHTTGQQLAELIAIASGKAKAVSSFRQAATTPASKSHRGRHRAKRAR